MEPRLLSVMYKWRKINSSVVGPIVPSYTAPIYTCIHTLVESVTALLTSFTHDSATVSLTLIDTLNPYTPSILVVNSPDNGNQ